MGVVGVYRQQRTLLTPMTASSELVLVEDDSDGGCSWCPVATEEGKEDAKASLDFWTKGEELRKSKKWAAALVYFNRGVVANPQNAACWSSISKVSQMGQRGCSMCVFQLPRYCLSLLPRAPEPHCRIKTSRCALWLTHMMLSDDPWFIISAPML